MRLKFYVCLLLFKVTKNRKWVLKCVDILMKRDEKLVKEFYNDSRR